MPIDYSIYPPDWKERRERILKRAKNRCECLGECGNGHKGGRCSMRHKQLVGRGFLPPKKIVLTIGHMDHDPENWEVSDDRLRAWCQGCHLRYDLDHHQMNAKYTRNPGQMFGKEEFAREE